MEQISCIFCKQQNNSVAICQDGYTGKRCHECQLIYISPRPTEQTVVNIYGHDDAQISAQAHIGGSLLKRLYARHTLTLIRRHLPKSKKAETPSLLEIGSGAGYFLDEARKKGFSSYAIELNPIQANFIKQNLHIPCENSLLSAASFGATRFDAIYHSDVISHFYDPVAAFNIMHEKLNANGLLVFETGNIAEINKDYFPAFTSFQYPDHLFFFSEHSIKLLLEKTGFELLAIHRYNILPQLKLLKWLHKPKQPSTSAQSTQTQKNSFIKNAIKNGYYLGSYCLRYKLGAWLPKSERPQTMIVMARKKD